MPLVSELSISYQCHVRQSGYNLTGSRKELTPRHNSEKQIREFEIQTLKDFLKLGDPLAIQKREAEDNRVRFCNLWGPLQNERENAATFDYWLNRLWKAEEARKKFDVPEFNLEFRRASFSWTYSEEGRLIPTVKCANLAQALTTCWSFVLDPLEEKGTRMCKFYRNYGSRKSCQKYFEINRGNKEFCSADCKSAFNRKLTLKKIREEKGKENNDSS